MQAFINHLNEQIPLTREEIETIKENIYVEEFPAKSHILCLGQISRRIGFILRGVTKVYHYDEEGNEIIKCFHNENHFIGDVNSYQNETVSENCVLAITDCLVVFFTKEKDMYLHQTLKKWPLLIRKLTEKALMDKVNNITNLVHADAKTKYLDFLEKHADIAQRVPLGDLASYLGIAQQSLSRIRKNISL